MKTDYRVSNQDNVMRVVSHSKWPINLSWLVSLFNAHLASYGVSPVDYHDIIVDNKSLSVVVHDHRDSRFVVVVHMQLRRLKKGDYTAMWTSKRLNIAAIATAS